MLTFEFIVMVGDVNIFFNDPDNDSTFGEIEVMIAEPDYRRTGRGKEALDIIMGYGNIYQQSRVYSQMATNIYWFTALEVVGIKTFQAKISLKNDPSINLFKSKFGFYEVSISKVFEEIVLEWTILEPARPLEKDEDGNEIEVYGSKATKEELDRISNIHKDLIYKWKSNVISTNYE